MLTQMPSERPTELPAVTPEAQTQQAQALLAPLLGREALDELDCFDQLQLASVIRVCRSVATLSEAGRVLFQASRAQRRARNDADRLRKYLARFGLDWARIQV
jgi:transcriptional regulatory protein RtcR